MLQRNNEPEWWRQAVIYQIYPRSFADSNGDGIGDLKGITSHIPYLKALGIDAVWLSPFYPSPLKDGGYDITDYRNVDPRIGTLEDFDELTAKLREIGIRVIVDLVPNHSSDEHEWFKAAVAAGKGSSEREKYIFKDGLGANKDLPPNDWQCLFGGSAWSPSGVNDGQWYFHVFDQSQPDLNWDHPDIKQDFLKTLRFWGDRGVAGFRVDFAQGLSKDLRDPLPNWEEMIRLTDQKLRNGNSELQHPYLDRDEVQEIYRSWRKVFDQYEPPLMGVAESWVAPDRKHHYASAEGLGQAFSFDILLCNFNADEYRRCIDGALKVAESSTTWVLSNHDLPRHATRFGMPDIANHNPGVYRAGVNEWLLSNLKGCNVERGQRRARAATLLILGLPGSTYIYQGEELGLPEIADIPPSQRHDPNFHRTNGKDIGRDGCRIPIPWKADAPNFGNGSGKPPHLPQPAEFKEYAVDVEENDPNSFLTLYRKAINLRKKLLPREEFEWLQSERGVLHFRRPGGWEVVINTFEDAVTLPPGKVILSSGVEQVDGKLPGETTIWLQNK